METLEIIGCSSSFENVEIVKLLHVQGSMSLAEAKATLERVLEGHSQVVKVPEKSDATTLLTALRNAGALVRLGSGG